MWQIWSGLGLSINPENRLFHSPGIFDGRNMQRKCSGALNLHRHVILSLDIAEFKTKPCKMSLIL